MRPREQSQLMQIAPNGLVEEHSDFAALQEVSHYAGEQYQSPLFFQFLVDAAPPMELICAKQIQHLRVNAS